MVMSEKLRAAIKLSRQRNYEIALAAELDPTTLSKWLNGIARLRPNDPRLARLADVMGLSVSECVMEDEEREEVTA